MSISQQARQVIERPLDRSRVKSREGGRGMTFDYIPTEYAIQLLNEAFDYSWESRVFMHEIHENTMAIVGVELKVWDENNSPIIKQQFGSCNINKGVDVGSALKGAASDGLKKCASQFGLALELYLDEAALSSVFQPPQRGEAAKTRPVVSPPSAQRPPVERETRIAPPSSNFSRTVSRPAAPPAPPAPPSMPSNRPSFSSAKNTASATVQAPRPNPFASNSGDKGINSTQMSALLSLSSKKGVSQSDLISFAQIVDAQGMPKQTFEELNHGEAIQVIKAAQQQ